jgi:signal transduction histidine kinase
MKVGHAVLIDHYPSYPRAIPAFVEVGVTSVVGVPIVKGDKIFGAMCVTSIGKQKSFLEQDVSILTAIGRQAGIAVENAYLYENLRFYARRITHAQEEERKRIARELHDDTIQSLIGLSRRLEALVTGDEELSEPAARRIRELWEQTDDVIHRVRRFSRDLRPSILDDLGLLPTLEELTNDLSRQSGLQTEFQVVGTGRRLPSEVELTLFRVVQEALTNVRKHARATRAVTTVTLTDSTIRVTVQDNGRGFDPPAPSEPWSDKDVLGLIGMHERVRLLGGTLLIESGPNRGTRVTANVPV